MSGVSSIALFTPVVASSAIFSSRRAKRGVDAMDENPIYGVMNMNIAAAQVLKAARAAKAISFAINPENVNTAVSASEAIKKISDTNKVVNGIGKVINFTANNINPVICLASFMGVALSDKELDEKINDGAEESIALSSMFGSEKVFKWASGMPITQVDENGVKKLVAKKGAYAKNPFLKKQIEAMKCYCDEKTLFNKISLNAVPGVVKGLLFVGASIGGYKAGKALANYILGNNKKEEENPKETQITNN